MNTSDWINAIIAAFTAASALFTGVTVGVTKSQTKTSTQMTCMTTYSAIQSKRLKVGDTTDAKNYYRELLDLDWFEYYASAKHNIDPKVFDKWVESWHDMYVYNDSVVDTLRPHHAIYFTREWQAYKRTHYFHPGDPFVDFMESVFSTKSDTTEDNKQLKALLRRKLKS